MNIVHFKEGEYAMKEKVRFSDEQLGFEMQIEQILPCNSDSWVRFVDESGEEWSEQVQCLALIRWREVDSGGDWLQVIVPCVDQDGWGGGKNEITPVHISTCFGNLKYKINPHWEKSIKPAVKSA